MYPFSVGACVCVCPNLKVGLLLVVQVCKGVLHWTHQGCLWVEEVALRLTFD